MLFICLWVDIGRSRNTNKIRIAVGEFGVQRCSQIQLFQSDIFRSIHPELGTSGVNQSNLLRNNTHSVHCMVLKQQSGNREAHIACSSNRHCIILHDTFSSSFRKCSFMLIRCGYHLRWCCHLDIVFSSRYDVRITVWCSQRRIVKCHAVNAMITSWICPKQWR